MKPLLRRLRNARLIDSDSGRSLCLLPSCYQRALSRSGYTGHEDDLDGMDRDQFLNLHLLPHEPLYQLLSGPISKA